MKSLLSYMIGAGLGLWLATIFIASVTVKALPGSNFFGISLSAQWEWIVLLGIIIGLLNYFVKPILNTLALPLRIITLGLFSFVINMFLIWVCDYMFAQLRVPFFWPLFWTTLIVWILTFVVNKFVIKED